ncbi:MAG: response regulator [Anaerolineae bacterium]|nr:response regulator [Anaerolineae bacterium]
MAETVDELDLQIITLLQEDGRTSNVEMARALGVAESTVRKRLERLLQNGVVRIVAIPDLPQVGWPVRVLLSLQVSPARVREAARRLARLPEVLSLHFTTGEYQLVAEVCFPSEEDLHAFLTERLPSLPGVVRATSAQVLQTLKGAEAWRLPQPTPPTILVVDDDPDFVGVVRTVLRAEGFQVRSASDGQEALAQMQASLPSLVILDVMMRGILDGVHVSDAMRQDQRLSRIPVLMVSSIPESPYAEMFPTNGNLHVDGFLTKPVSPERLVDEVRRLLVPRRPARQGEAVPGTAGP